MSLGTHNIADRILVLSGWYPSPLEPNNGDFVKEQVELLRKTGLEIDLVYADLNIAYLSKGKLSRQEVLIIDHAGNYDHIVSGPIWPKNQQWGLRHWVQQYADIVESYLDKHRGGRSPRLIHSHTYLGGAVALELKRRRSIPYIVTEHYTGWLDDSIKSDHKALGKKVMDGAEIVLGVSPSLQSELAKHTKTETRVLPNFINTDFFKPANLKTKKTFQYIGVGDLIVRKNWRDLIMAFSKVIKSNPEAHLVIAGEGPERGKLENLIRDLSLKERISLPGHLDRQDLLKCFQDSDVLVHTSQSETFGLVLAEAMACGLPVISYPNHAALYVLSEQNGIVTKENSTSDLSKAMEKVRVNYSLYDRGEIRTDVIRRFGVATAKKSLAAIYSELCQE